MLFGNLSLIQTAVTAVSIYLVGWIIYCRYFHSLLHSRALPRIRQSSMDRL